MSINKTELTQQKVRNKMNELQLKEVYFANVSGGKDSLYMLRHILANRDIYPLDGVVHFELEIDYPFIKNVVDYMETECKRFNIPFYRIKPRKKWIELYERYGFPTRVARWCNSHYKLDCARQLEAMEKEKGNKVIHYVGICADEKNRVRDNSKFIYPLYEMGIEETTILEWAKTVDIFNDYYKYNKRCGCMYCPMSSMSNLAYLYVYYREEFEKMFYYARKSEKEIGNTIFSGNEKYNVDYYYNIVINKHVPKLLSEMCHE